MPPFAPDSERVADSAAPDAKKPSPPAAERERGLDDLSELSLGTPVNLDAPAQEPSTGKEPELSHAQVLDSQPDSFRASPEPGRGLTPWQRLEDFMISIGDGLAEIAASKPVAIGLISSGLFLSLSGNFLAGAGCIGMGAGILSAQK